jgi:putative tryptophan/tyrosine transport system substrate-binding protein
LEAAITTYSRLRYPAVEIMPGRIFLDQRQRLADLALRNRLATIYGQREYVDAGGLLSYGSRLQDLFRRAAAYVEKILKGAKPAELPIEQPTTFEFVINLKTARALGLTIPPSLLARAVLVSLHGVGNPGILETTCLAALPNTPRMPSRAVDQVIE